uniref:RING-type domain-containing protein n=1 Tax=Chromera velia CCMP2878 TaxID=1169474 RepID=A0A0G4HC70_9ALVE|eukprot:Cvel_6302.t1-p1 / transcript=Cvel_6302.t1 / gene=Cvel_6302 / organism=Chromera_velia_CCMP2878 / gene_product=Uncharacterized protein DDB_G0292642, putative / transcript_product=Uncharacterized protein DDB_G0292642, putative / location=Cvel_scaffold306:8585-12869(-) / protein_length=822 / sequence_SO=supercontig / SO=protein_coding / is_pseudo=false
MCRECLKGFFENQIESFTVTFTCFCTSDNPRLPISSPSSGAFSSTRSQAVSPRLATRPQSNARGGRRSASRLSLRAAGGVSLSPPEEREDTLATAQCGAPVSNNLVMEIVSETHREKLTRFRMMKEDPRLRECPSCNFLQKGNPRKPAMTCQKCEMEYCYAHADAHPSTETCQAYERRTGTVDQHSRTLIDQTCRSCPGCRFAVSKEAGCNHIVCSRCSTSFCWICGSKIEDSIFPRHFAWWNVWGCPLRQMQEEVALAVRGGPKYKIVIDVVLRVLYVFLLFVLVPFSGACTLMTAPILLFFAYGVCLCPVEDKESRTASSRSSREGAGGGGGQRTAATSRRRTSAASTSSSNNTSRRTARTARTVPAVRDRDRGGEGNRNERRERDGRQRQTTAPGSAHDADNEADIDLELGHADVEEGGGYQAEKSDEAGGERKAGEGGALSSTERERDASSSSSADGALLRPFRREESVPPPSVAEEVALAVASADAEKAGEGGGSSEEKEEGRKDGPAQSSQERAGATGRQQEQRGQGRRNSSGGPVRRRGGCGCCWTCCAEFWGCCGDLFGGCGNSMRKNGAWDLTLTIFTFWGYAVIVFVVAAVLAVGMVIYFAFCVLGCIAKSLWECLCKSSSSRRRRETSSSSSNRGTTNANARPGTGTGGGGSGEAGGGGESGSGDRGVGSGRLPSADATAEAVTGGGGQRDLEAQIQTQVQGVGETQIHKEEKSAEVKEEERQPEEPSPSPAPETIRAVANEKKGAHVEPKGGASFSGTTKSTEEGRQKESKDDLNSKTLTALPADFHVCYSPIPRSLLAALEEEPREEPA